MLQNHVPIDNEPTTTHGFIVSVELTGRVSPEQVRLKLADALTWVEGLGDVDVDWIGEIDRYPEPNPVDSTDTRHI